MLDALGPRFKRNMKNGRELGPWQWVVELTLTWLNQLRRLRVRFEERADIHEAFLGSACSLPGWNVLQRQG